VYKNHGVSADVEWRNAELVGAHRYLTVISTILKPDLLILHRTPGSTID
jgi:hypothetical protein